MLPENHLVDRATARAHFRGGLAGLALAQAAAALADAQLSGWLTHGGREWLSPGRLFPAARYLVLHGFVVNAVLACLHQVVPLVARRPCPAMGWSQLVFGLCQTSAVLGTIAILAGVGEARAWGEAPNSLDAATGLVWLVASCGFLLPLMTCEARTRFAGAGLVVALCSAAPVFVAGNFAFGDDSPGAAAQVYPRLLLGAVGAPLVFSIAAVASAAAGRPRDHETDAPIPAWNHPGKLAGHVGLWPWLAVQPFAAAQAAFDADAPHLATATAIALAVCAVPAALATLGAARRDSHSRECASLARWSLVGMILFAAGGIGWLCRELFAPQLAESADWIDAVERLLVVGPIWACLAGIFSDRRGTAFDQAAAPPSWSAFVAPWSAALMLAGIVVASIQLHAGYLQRHELPVGFEHTARGAWLHAERCAAIVGRLLIAIGAAGLAAFPGMIASAAPVAAPRESPPSAE